MYAWDNPTKRQPTSMIVHRVKYKGTFWTANGDDTAKDFHDELWDHYDVALYFGEVSRLQV
jgi:hypothetical protein